MPGTFSQLRFHLVFSTKHREAWITPELQARLHPFIAGIIKDERGLPLEVGGMPDHVHLLIGWRTDESLATLMRNVKARSSAWIHREFPNLVKFAWQEGYGAFTVSHSVVPKVRQYIQTQPEHHRRKTFQEEFLELLKAHDIAYDERYVFD
jgi:REP element-mobilizing transposase RayT